MKKIFFYGNCQAAVIGEWLHNNYSHKFDVFDCKDCKLERFWNTKNFAVWSPENSPNQQNYYPYIHEKIKEADVFVFHSTNRACIDELRTDYLCSEIAKDKLNICLPNPRFFAYPMCIDSVIPFIKYVYQHISQDENVIIDYFLNNNDPEFKKLVFSQLQACMDENILRHQINLTKYENVIEINDFIKENWNKHLLFGTHNHPIGLYWSELIRSLFNLLDEPLEEETLNSIYYPNKDGIHNIMDISFFKNIAPTINIPIEIPKSTITKTILRYPLAEHYK